MAVCSTARICRRCSSEEQLMASTSMGTSQAEHCQGQKQKCFLAEYLPMNLCGVGPLALVWSSNHPMFTAHLLSLHNFEQGAKNFPSGQGMVL